MMKRKDLIDKLLKYKESAFYEIRVLDTLLKPAIVKNVIELNKYLTDTYIDDEYVITVECVNNVLNVYID